MKKVILTIFALAAFGTASAQIKFGVKGGINLSTITGDVSDDITMKPGAHVGGFVKIGLMDKLFLQPELLFSMQGAKTKDYWSYGGGEFEREENNYNLSYINIPIMGRYYIVKGFNVEFGPQFGILVSAKSKYEYTETFDNGFGLETYSESRTIDIKDSLKTIDVGLNIGAGYDFNDHMGVGLRYNFGLTDIDDFAFSETKNSVLSASFLYTF
ncbi:porin family protein [Flavobacterium caeni]|uniref:Outer membrane protein beta-barrel domain-containing protein n=1 Tax=Flavobacterium caeni TaxID=490189 RepID=A0A1G5HLK9_9FLAO|nr:porin family protein [Flavobacterium caeni]SCY64656.1 Outer membrane protein beta-barrel domain-containing protein [Flavobacterium caeni]